MPILPQESPYISGANVVFVRLLLPLLELCPNLVLVFQFLFSNSLTLFSSFSILEYAIDTKPKAPAATENAKISNTLPPN